MKNLKTVDAANSFERPRMIRYALSQLNRLYIERLNDDEQFDGSDFEKECGEAIADLTAIVDYYTEKKR